MATCKECEQEFRQNKTWQLFCTTKCRDDWHNREKKHALVEEAERRRELRLASANGANGASNPKPLSEIMQARTVEPPPPMRRPAA
jgi:hypothetical protein